MLFLGTEPNKTDIEKNDLLLWINNYNRGYLNHTRIHENKALYMSILCLFKCKNTVLGYTKKHIKKTNFRLIFYFDYDKITFVICRSDEIGRRA